MEKTNCLAGGQLIAGVDEAGRGPLAGPVIAAAVILDPKQVIEHLKDSKGLTAAKRTIVYADIVGKSIAYAIGRAEVEEIDRLNIHHASLLAMKRAVQALSIKPQSVIVDGKFCPDVDCQVSAVIKGDQKVAAISAASILAKVTRDREMIQYDAFYPGYGFAEHKGYGTSKHLSALNELGVTPIHRHSFAPVRAVANQSRMPYCEVE